MSFSKHVKLLCVIPDPISILISTSPFFPSRCFVHVLDRCRIRQVLTDDNALIPLLLGHAYRPREFHSLRLYQTQRQTCSTYMPTLSSVQAPRWPFHFQPPDLALALHIYTEYNHQSINVIPVYWIQYWAQKLPLEWQRAVYCCHYLHLYGVYFDSHTSTLMDILK